MPPSRAPRHRETIAATRARAHAQAAAQLLAELNTTRSFWSGLRVTDADLDALDAFFRGPRGAAFHARMLERDRALCAGLPGAPWQGLSARELTVGIEAGFGLSFALANGFPPGTANDASLRWLALLAWLVLALNGDSTLAERALGVNAAHGFLLNELKRRVEKNIGVAGVTLPMALTEGRGDEAMAAREFLTRAVRRGLRRRKKGAEQLDVWTRRAGRAEVDEEIASALLLVIARRLHGRQDGAGYVQALLEAVDGSWNNVARYAAWEIVQKLARGHLTLPTALEAPWYATDGRTGLTDDPEVRLLRAEIQGDPGLLAAYEALASRESQASVARRLGIPLRTLKRRIAELRRRLRSSGR